MKKLSVLLVAAAVAISASAGVSFKSTHVLKANKMVNKENVKFNDKAAKAKADFRVITDQPEGELKSYNRSGQYDYNSSGYLYCGQQDGNRMDIVYAEDGKVYMKNILCGTANSFGNYWVEGTIEGNEIHVPLGQEIYYSDYYQASVLLAWGEAGIDEDGNIFFERDERPDEAIYVIDGTTISLQGSEGSTGGDYNVDEDYHGIGLTAYWEDDDSWTGFLEWNTVLTEREPVVTPTLITEIPEGCEVVEYYRHTGYIASSYFGISNGMTDGKINIAFDPTCNDVYVQNPSWWHDSYGTWVKGTLDPQTNIISIPVGQYLSWSDEYEYGIVLGMGSTYVYQDGYDEEGNPAYYLGTEIDERAEEIQILIDGDNLYLLGSEGDVNAEFPLWGNATGMMTYYSDDLSMTSIEFANNGEPMGYVVNLVPAVPANPTADEWYDCGDESGFSRFYFTLPTTDVDGNILDPEHLSYSIFVDNGNGAEMFTFPAVDYTYDLTEDITEVTYDLYNSAVDFRDYFCYFYRTNEEGFEPLFTENIGIQVYYTVNGIRNASEIVWLYDIDTNVAEINAGKTVANVRYFNVAGQEMAQPSGMTIMITTYTDGTTSAAKVVK